MRKVVIPAAGLGTRLLPATKEQPKEMLPIFSRSCDDSLCLKPLLQAVFEQLYDFGLREFCFIVGRGKRAIEDHFTPDHSNLDMLRSRGKDKPATDLESFYEKLRASIVIWVNQPEPLGFGDAVLKAKTFVGEEEFLVHAGDTYIVSDSFGYIERLMDTYRRLGADATFIVKRVEDPRQYGVVRCEAVDQGVYRVIEAVEKPEVPPTNLAVMPIYIFKSSIFGILSKTRPGRGGEVQLTDGIQGMIGSGLKVFAIELGENELWLDIGTPNTYWEALSQSYRSMSPLKG
ncbi:MAG: UTP--glucose-1-phosphate uridylyltransferase [Candidatus Bathyarchaeia archaeon]